MQDPDERPGRPMAGSPVRPLGAAGIPREILLPLSLLVVAIVIAVIQPWGVVPARPTDLAPGQAAGSGATAATAEPPSPTPADPYAELVATCGYPSGWRAATLQRWIGREASIRTWTAVDPVLASDAADSSIPFAPVATDLVVAIGYCSPLDASQPPTSVEVAIWSVLDDGPPVHLADLERLEPTHPNALGGLWLPGDAMAMTVDGTVGWAPGRYAIRLVAGGFDRWLGVEIQDISGLHPGPTASP